jgi:single-strand DNA-binding protein
MASLNKVFLMGNLTRDPELRYTPSGTAVATLRLAVNKIYKDKSGQQQKETCFINVVAWGPIAETSNQYLTKGRPVLVEGELVSRSWQGNDGQKRNVIEVRASRVQFMPGGPREPKEADSVAEPQEVAPETDDAGQELGAN